MADWMPVLMAQAWQVTLLVVVVAAINRWAGKSRPHLAHALWLVVLVKCVTPPIWSSPSGVFCWLQPSQEFGLPPLAVEESSQSWSDLLAAARSTEPSDVLEQADRDWLGSDNVVEESLLGVGDEWIETLPPPSITSDIEWSNVLLGLWVSASLGVLGVAIVRWLRCWRMVRSAPQRNCAELSAQLDALAKQLRLRRRVRLIVTESRIGPAVIGLFRTTVLLPALIVDRLAQRSPVAESSPVAPRQESRTSFDSQSSREFASQLRDGHPVAERQGYESLAPILAHELLHIRRGDLWVGLLQTVAQAVWWCHPLVWWVNRRATREAERCCDEEVLAELGCDPAAYARALVDVLELKRELKPVPVFPGVRPVEVTTQRLERIMQLGQGCQRRTPWWCWLLAGLAAAATWPGAAFVVTAEDPGERGGVSPPVSAVPLLNRGADAAPFANASDGPIDLDKEPNLGLAYRVRVISGAEDDLRALAQKFNEKLIAKPGDPIIVEHDELLRLLKEAQAFPRLKLKSHPVATGRGRKSVTIADTATFAIPVEVTAADGTAMLYEQSHEYGWRLTLQPRTVGIETLRLNVENSLTRLNNHASAKVRFPTGEEKLIPGLDVHRINTTVELKNGQHVVFPITKVPNADSQDVMLVMMQARLLFLEEAPQQPEPTPPVVSGPPIGRGVNSDSGVSGEIVLEEPAGTPITKDNADAPAASPVSRYITGWSDPVFRKQTSHKDRVEESGFADLQLDSLGQLVWQHGSWFIVVRPEPGRKLIDSSRSPHQFQSNGAVRITLTKLAGGTSHRNQLTMTGDAWQLKSEETGLMMQLSGDVRLTGQGLSTKSESLALMLPWPPKDVSGAADSTLRLRGHVMIRSNRNGERTELIADDVILYAKGTALSRLEPSADGIVGVLREPPSQDDFLIRFGKMELSVAKSEKLVSVNFENVPLKEAMKQLAQSTGRNIVLDKAGLEDEALTDRAPITLAVDQVKLSSALKLMLDPLNLGYRVEESGVIVVTSQKRLKGQPVVVTYAVADLAVPMPKRAAMKLTADLRTANEESKPYDTTTSKQSQLPELVKLITSTCQPNSWEEVAGNGSIKVNDSTLSLVVRQTQDVHDEIRDLLEQMRRLQSLQASLHVETLTVPADFWHKVGKDFDDPEADGQPIPQPRDKSVPRSIARLTKKEAALLRSLSRPESAPKVTLFTGQELEVFFGGESPTMRLGLKPIVGTDHQGLSLQAVATKPDAELDFAKLAAITLDSGHSLLLDVTEVYSVGPTAGVPILNKVPGEVRLFKNTGKSDHRTLLLITGTVVIVEEEEAREPSHGDP